MASEQEKQLKAMEEEKRRRDEEREAAEREFLEKFERERRLSRSGGGGSASAASSQMDSESEAETKKKRARSTPTSDERRKTKKDKKDDTEEEEDLGVDGLTLGDDPLENMGKLLRKIRKWTMHPSNVKMIKKAQAEQLETYVSQVQEEIIKAREQGAVLETRVEERSTVIAETLRSVVKEELQIGKQHVEEGPKKEETFSRVLGRKEVPKISGVKWPVLPVPKLVVIRHENKDSEEVKKKLKEIVKPSEIGLKVKRLNMIRNGVIIEAESEEGVEKLMQNEALKKEGMKVGKPTKKLPVVMVYDVNSKLKDEEVKDEIFRRNMQGSEIPEDDFNKEFVIKHKYQERNERKGESKRNHLIAECSVRVRNWLRRKGRVFIEWESCRIKDYVDVTRCFKCQRYGHVAKNCTNAKASCSHCSGEHEYKECKKKNLKEGAKCINCVRDNRKEVNHPSSWRGCPVYEKAVKSYYLKQCNNLERRGVFYTQDHFRCCRVDMEVAEQLFISLESNQPEIVEEIKKKFHELFNSCNPNDAWLVNGLFDYSMQTGSLRTVEILVGIREPHDAHLFNKFSESLRNNNKLHGLTLLGHIVRRQPTWLYKITRHSLFKELLRLLKTETEIIPLMSALLVVNILLPMVAGLMEPYLQDLFQVFSHLAVWDTINPNKLSEAHLLHLQMALYALFLRLYGMYPCNFLSYLRQEYSQQHKKPIFSHTIKPMLDNVKMHPLLVTASKDFEVAPSRWRKMEPHDVVVECAKFAIGGEMDRVREEGGSRTSLDFTQTLESKYTSRSGSVADKDVWSPTSYCGMSTPPESAPTSIPHTPIAQTHIVSTSFPQQEGTSPPEAAVEATPETTPIKDLRSVVRGPPSNSNVPRALNAISSSPNHSQPSSPMKKEPSPFRFPSNSESSAFHQPMHDMKRDSLITQKVQRIVTDRSQITSEHSEGKMKPRVLLQPTSPLRVINGSGLGSESPADLTGDQEDKEVESMMTSDNNSSNWNSRHCDSVVQDIPSNDHDELEDCQQETCTAGGLCMPNSNSMLDFARQVKSRLRYYSQCHADTPCKGLSTGSSPSDGSSIPVTTKVRRANSCPEMKKTSSSLERHPVEKVEEEPSPVNGHGMDFAEVSSDAKKTACTGTQTDNPLPYEHLFLAVFPTVELSHHHLVDDTSSGLDTGHSSPLPQKRFSPNEVDLFMNTNTSIICDVKKHKLGIDGDLKFCREQLLLMSLQLHFEKHRREMHAERNRRLLGKCRKVRSQEELTSALKDQLSLLQTDNEALHSNLHKRVDEAKAFAQQLQETITYYQNQNTLLQTEYTKEKAHRESTEQLLKQEKDKTASVVKELNETKASLFNATNELQHVANMANEGRDLRDTIQSLQRELVVGGEVQERYRQRVNSLLRHLNQSSEVSLLQESFSQQISGLNQALESQTAALEAAKTRVGELDTLLVKKDATIAESKRLLQEAKDEYHEQLEAVESKYNSLRAVNSRLEGELLELRHQLTSSQPTVHPSLPPSLTPAPPLPFHNLQAMVDVPDTSPPHSPAADHNG